MHAKPNHQPTAWPTPRPSAAETEVQQSAPRSCAKQMANQNKQQRLYGFGNAIFLNCTNRSLGTVCRSHARGRAVAILGAASWHLFSSGNSNRVIVCSTCDAAIENMFWIRLSASQGEDSQNRNHRHRLVVHWLLLERNVKCELTPL